MLLKKLQRLSSKKYLVCEFQLSTKNRLIFTFFEFFQFVWQQTNLTGFLPRILQIRNWTFLKCENWSRKKRGKLRFIAIWPMGPWSNTKEKLCPQVLYCTYVLFFGERERKPSSNKYIWRENFLMMIAIKEVTPQKINLTKPPMRPTPWTILGNFRRFQFMN